MVSHQTRRLAVVNEGFDITSIGGDDAFPCFNNTFVASLPICRDFETKRETLGHVYLAIMRRIDLKSESQTDNKTIRNAEIVEMMFDF